MANLLLGRCGETICGRKVRPGELSRSDSPAWQSCWETLPLIKFTMSSICLRRKPQVFFVYHLR